MCLPDDDSSTTPQQQEPVVVTYQEMTPAQQRIVDAVKSPTIRLPESLTTAQQIEEWMEANGM